MAAITDLSDLVNRLTGGNSGTPEVIWKWIDQRAQAIAAVTAVGRWTSFWQWDSAPGGAGAAPGAIANPDNTTSGALKQTDPGGGRTKYLVGGSFYNIQSGELLVYDRLQHISGMDPTSNTAQTVGGSLTRYTDGVGNQIWIEIYTQVGATSRTITASYSNTVPTSGQTTPAVNIGNTGLREIQRMIPMQIASGDTGVSAVASVTLSASLGAGGGDFGVTVIHPLMLVPFDGTGMALIRDGIAQIPSIPEIKTGACLAQAFYASSATPTSLWMSFHFMEE